MTLKSNIPTRVIKLGGSLLDLPELPTKFTRWLKSQPLAMNLIVVGGGQLVEAMRELDRHHTFDSRQMHWWCVDLLATTARLAASLLPGTSLIETPRGLQSVIKNGGQDSSFPTHFVVPPDLFYFPEIEKDTSMLVESLPQNWSTTTDSIAGVLAILAQAEELVLLKSVSASHRMKTVQQWCEYGLVDRAFPLLVPQLPRVRLVNLRAVNEVGIFRSDAGRVD